MQRWCAIVVSVLFCAGVMAQGDYELVHVIETIYSTAVEEGDEPDFEELQERLTQLSEEKININQATPDDLRQLLFLDEEKIERVLVYRDQYPLHSVYELQLIPGLSEWEYRYLALFVEAGEKEKKKVYAHELFKNGHHEVDLRLDARSIEDYTGDPMYTSLKYKFRSMRKLEFGLTAERDAGEPWWGKKTYGFDHYGGYVQLNDVWKFKTVVVGDYRAQFGLGLVMSGQMKLGKSSYVSNLNFGGQGLKKHSSCDEWNFFRGAGATGSFGPVDVSAWYSYKRIDANVQDGVFPSIVKTGYHRTETEISHKKTVGQHVIGMNVTYNWKSLRVGLTAVENLMSDTLRPKTTYYNTHYFSGKRQTTIGAFAMYSYKRWQVFGEVATAQNTKWGVATLVGSKITPADDVHLLAIGRYYSPWFDNMFASAFGETSKNNDELGLYLGAEVLRVKNWRFSVYADMYKFSGPKYGIRDTTGGFEIQGETGWQTTKELNMQLRARYKRKAGIDKWTGRYQLSWQKSGWTLRTQLEGNIYNEGKVSLGGMIFEQVEYSFQKVPIVLQARMEWFDARNWNNRMYAYENDVLYAFNIPASYGQGGRWYLNFRYKINDHYALYLKAAETVYTKKWMAEKNLANQTKTDIHLMLKITY